MRRRPRSSRLLVVVALVALPLACGDYGSLGDHVTPPCGAIPLADIAAGSGGFAIDGEAAHDFSGVSVSVAGDVNGDGLADMLVAASSADPNGIDGAGRTYVVLGKADNDTVQLADVAQGIGGFAIDGEAERDLAGWSTSGAGDVNGDGLADVIVGAAGAEPNGPNSGRTYVVFGKADAELVSLTDVTQKVGGFAIDGEAEDDHTGATIAGAGDVNGDGLTDVIVGSMFGFDGLGGSDLVYVVFGKMSTDRVLLADVAAGAGGFALDGGTEHGDSGFSVSGAGDVNGDGLADVIVGAPRAGSADLGMVGRSYVVFGKADTEPIDLADVAGGAGGFAMDGAGKSDCAGYSVSGAGDVNGDGLADVIVGAYLAEVNGVEHVGRAYVVFGKTSTDKVELADVAQGIGGLVLDGKAEWSDSGHAVAGGGDVNGDGIPDLLVAAPRVDSNGEYSGRTYVAFGFACTDAGG